jgi:hypothetical protein
LRNRARVAPAADASEMIDVEPMLLPAYGPVREGAMDAGGVAPPAVFMEKEQKG